MSNDWDEPLAPFRQAQSLLCPFPIRRQEALRLAGFCRVGIGPEDEVYRLAQSLQAQASLSAKDAVHLACAAHCRAERFLTCDEVLVRRTKRLGMTIQIANPVDFVRTEAAHGDDDSAR